MLITTWCLYSVIILNNGATYLIPIFTINNITFRIFRKLQTVLIVTILSNIENIFSITYFSPVLWPEFSLWQLLSGIFFFQRQNKKLEKLLEDDNNIIDCKEHSWRLLEQRRQVSSVLESWTHLSAWFHFSFLN